MGSKSGYRRRQPKKTGQLHTGQLVLSAANKSYKVEGTLNGECGIYAVRLQDAPDKDIVMKAKLRGEDRLNTLGNELTVYEEIQKASADIDKTRFIAMIDKGKTPDFKFIVLETVSVSIADIQYRMHIVKSFTPYSFCHIVRETLKAVQTLHKMGYVHRNLTPRNFFVGCPPNESKIYLIDFGLARKYQPDEKKRKRNLSFVGASRYASLACHEGKEQDRKDDLESWIYSMFEIWDKEALIWRRERDFNDVYRLKKLLVTKPDESPVMAMMPLPLFDYIKYVPKMAYGAAPDYNFMFESIPFLEKMDPRPADQRTLDWAGQIPPAIVFKTNQDDETDFQEVRRRRGIERKKSNLELKLAKMYKELGENLTAAEIKAAIRERAERKKREAEEKERRKRKADGAAMLKEKTAKAEKEKKRLEEEARKIVNDAAKEKIEDPSKIATKEAAADAPKEKTKGQPNEKIKDQSKEKVEEKEGKNNDNDDSCKTPPRQPAPKKDEDFAKTPPRDMPQTPPTPSETPQTPPTTTETPQTPPTPNAEGEAKKEMTDEEKKKKLAQMMDDYMALDDVNEVDKADKEKEDKDNKDPDAEDSKMQQPQTSSVSPVQQVQLQQPQELQQVLPAPPPTGKEAEPEKK